MKLRINGEEHEVELSDRMPLLWALRDHLKLTGTKYGCGIAQCGACTVLADGNPIRSCVTPLAVAAAMEIRTIEGLEGQAAEAVLAAWQALDVPQCGYCQSGQVTAAVGLLSANPSPSDDEIDGALSGNLCRCVTYARIRRAVRQAAASLQGDGDRGQA